MYTYICAKCVLIYVPIYAIIYIVKEMKVTFTAEEIERSEDNAEYAYSYRTCDKVCKA
jgi:hypothetical protein